MLPDYSNTDLPFTESKTEVSINRITAIANPRTFERVPAGAQFKIQLVLNVFDDDNENELKTVCVEPLPCSTTTISADKAHAVTVR